MIIPDTFLFVISMTITGAILFLLVYFVLTLTDLECDYLNAQECCAKLNLWVIPKLVAHVFVTALLFMHGHWIVCLINLPVAAWLSLQVARVPKGNLGVYDPMEIHNRGQLKVHLRDCMICLGYYLMIFFMYLYCMITAMLKDDPIKSTFDEDIMY